MKEFLIFVLSAIVDLPDRLEVIEEEVDGRIIYKIKSDSSDMGRIIGKRGAIIRSIRNLVRIMAIKERKAVSVEIVEV